MNQVKFSEYLKDIVTKEGVLSSCYSTFHNYSLLNQLMASSQLQARGQNIAPIASYNRWKELGRQVKKGSKAIALLMPVVINKKDANGQKTDDKFQMFITRNNWFSLDDTEGADFKPEVKIAAWNKDKAMAALNINEIEFQKINGNSQGYAREREIAINPLAILPHKTRFHELAHVVLGHTAENALMSDSEHTPKSIKEVEAESVAYILCELLGLDGVKESRGYIQHWLNSETIPDKSAQKIFGAADKILKAGQ
jgi:antirestriction protein ArdC